MKKKYSTIIGLVIGGISLYIFVWHFFDWNETKQILAKIDLTLMGLAVSLFIFAYCVRAIKWTYILRCQENISWNNGYHATMVSNLANFILPVRFGEVIRLFIAKNTSKVSYASSTAASMVDIFSHMFFILLILFLSPFTETELPDWTVRFTPIFFVFLIVSIAIFLGGVKFSNFFRKGVEYLLSSFGIERDKIDNLLHGRIANFLKNSLEQCHISSFSRSNIFKISLLSFITICNDGLYFYFLILSFGMSFTYFQAILAACFLNIFFFLPSTPVRIGTAEMYPLLIFSGIFFLPSNIIATTALVWHILTTAIIAIMGITSMIALGLRMKTLFKMSSETDFAGIG